MGQAEWEAPIAAHLRWETGGTQCAALLQAEGWQVSQRVCVCFIVFIGEIWRFLVSNTENAGFTLSWAHWKISKWNQLMELTENKVTSVALWVTRFDESANVYFTETFFRGVFVFKQHILTWFMIISVDWTTNTATADWWSHSKHWKYQSKLEN